MKKETRNYHLKKGSHLEENRIFFRWLVVWNILLNNKKSKNVFFIFSLKKNKPLTFRKRLFEKKTELEIKLGNRKPNFYGNSFYELEIYHFIDE